MYVCLWSPDWSTAAASGAEGAGGREPGRREPGGRQGGAETGWEPGDDVAPPSSHDLAPLLAELAPRLRVEREVIWADGRGLDAATLARRLLERLAVEAVPARAGVAAVPVTAELAARWGPYDAVDPDGSTPFLVKERTGWGRRAAARSSRPPAEGPDPTASTPRAAAPHTPPPERGGSPAGRPESRPSGQGGERPGQGGERPGQVVAVPEGHEAEWQSALPVAALRPTDRVRALLDGVGIATVGQLAGLEREAVEVRFGGGVVALWRAARADDRRLLFDRIPPDPPHGSLDFVDYVLTDPVRLVFTANALLGPLCDRLTGRGEHARTLRIELPLANGDVWARTLRPARPTASRETWLRLIRGLLDELTVPDAVAGMRIEVPSTEAAAVRQGDLFDRGFATATAVEAAVARLAERQLWPVVPETDGHPVVERRGRWTRQAVVDATSAQTPGRDGVASRQGRPPASHGADSHLAPARDPSADGAGRSLTLMLMPEPRRIAVETARRRDHQVPVRIRDRGGWLEVAHAAGPDRISGGQWEASSYAREYWRCVTGGGVPLWVYRDALDGGWWLHGWWD